MNRDIERAETLLFQAIPVLLLQVRQGNEVPEQEAVAIIIIFDVERLAHAERQAALRLVSLR